MDGRPPLREKYSFVLSTVVRRDIVYVAAIDDAVDHVSIPHAHIFYSQAGQLGNVGMVDWGVVGLTLVKRPERRILAVGSMGQAVSIGQGQRLSEQVGLPSEGPQARGMIRCLGAINGIGYAGGMNRQLYRRSDVGVWDALDYDVPSAGVPVYDFEGLDGFGTDDVYAVGWHGEVVSYRGGSKRRVESPTNQILNGVCCAGDGNVYACGRSGVILIGRDEQWRVVEHDTTSEDFWSVAWFGNAAFFATSRFLYRLDGDRLGRVDMGPDHPETCYHLSTNGEVLVSTGKKDVMSFDGASWSRIF